MATGKGSGGRRSGSVRQQRLTPELLSEYIRVLKEHRIAEANIEGVGHIKLDSAALIDPSQLEAYTDSIRKITEGDGPDDLLFASATT
jgi:hypothetical protein